MTLMKKTGIVDDLQRGETFALDKLNLRCLVTYRWKNQEGRGVGTSELSKAVRAEDIHWASIPMHYLESHRLGKSQN